MNELDIYNIIKGKFDKYNKKLATIGWFTLGWFLYALISAIVLPELPLLLWAKFVIVFSPLLALGMFFLKFAKGKVKLAKRYPLFYNNWKDKSIFIYQLRNRVDSRAQNDPLHIKITNPGRNYIDDLITEYKADDKKLADAFYNGINSTRLVDEISYFEKFKSFKIQMNEYRNSI